jgi:hypothetical protein
MIHMEINNYLLKFFQMLNAGFEKTEIQTTIQIISK